jgi:SAM-dependent methyltransferase
MQVKLTIEEINEIIACPMCNNFLALVEWRDASCSRCQETYRWYSGTWDLIPSSYHSSSDLWPVWEQLQANGLVSYTHDAEHNLAVGERADCMEFSRFCGFDGLVLDVGCGPQAWPAYFRFTSNRTRLVGVDPLVRGSAADYVQFRALGEYLPFRSEVFDHVVFATSLDHFIDPAQALIEACRVCRLSGALDIWIGEKRPETPRPAVSPDWYMSLKKPHQADDVFHLKRFGSAEVKELFKQVGLHLVAEHLQTIDEFRCNWFYRLKIR